MLVTVELVKEDALKVVAEVNEGGASFVKQVEKETPHVVILTSFELETILSDIQRGAVGRTKITEITEADYRKGGVTLIKRNGQSITDYIALTEEHLTKVCTKMQKRNRT